jgi:hypothetical protein
MKTYALFFTVLTAGAALAQPGPLAPSATTETARTLQTVPEFAPPEKPNEIRTGRMITSGIAVEAVKVKNPLQLINPLAPPEYGSGQDNVVHNPVTGEAAGLKVLSFQF